MSQRTCWQKRFSKQVALEVKAVLDQLLDTLASPPLPLSALPLLPVSHLLFRFRTDTQLGALSDFWLRQKPYLATFSFVGLSLEERTSETVSEATSSSPFHSCFDMATMDGFQGEKHR